jgi:hypothetical protein
MPNTPTATTSKGDRKMEQSQYLNELKKVETAICEQVCVCHGNVTKWEINKRDFLREQTGMMYDAINQKFLAYYDKD